MIFFGTVFMFFGVCCEKGGLVVAGAILYATSYISDLVKQMKNLNQNMEDIKAIHYLRDSKDHQDY